MNKAYVSLTIPKQLLNYVIYTTKPQYLKGLTSEKLFIPLSKKVEDVSKKVTVVGIGQVGIQVVSSLITKRVTNNICMLDTDAKKLKGELMDLENASVFLNDVTISASTDYSISEGSAICVVTAGVRQTAKQTRLDIVQSNADVLKMIIPQIAKYSPNCILLIATNPCDVLTYAAWKLSKFPKNRVIGTGTLLDSARLQWFISRKLDMAPSAVHSYVIGEHGESAVVVWSSICVGGTRLIDINPKLGQKDDPENSLQIREDVVKVAYHIRMAKGFNSHACSMSVVTICDAILSNEQKIYPLTTYIKDMYGIRNEVFVSLPCVVGRTGIAKVVNIKLAAQEEEYLRKSADALYKAQEQIKW